MEFRDLKATEIDVRVGQCGKGYFSLLLYKDARVDMALLDESGAKWQRKHYELKNNMYCSVGIWDAELQQWLWRDDCGVESNTEGEKGESSDSFKRACVNWGIGRELYTSPKIFVKGDVTKTNDKGKTEPVFYQMQVADIDIQNKEIKALTIKGYNPNTKTNETIFTFGKGRDSGKVAPTKQEVSQAPKQYQGENISEVVHIPPSQKANVAPLENFGNLIVLEKAIQGKQITTTMAQEWCRLKFGKTDIATLSQEELNQLLESVRKAK